LAACARPPVAAACFGILVACLALTKINIGILAAAAMTVLFTFALPLPPSRRNAARMAGSVVVLLPFALMSPHLAQPWGFCSALVVALSLVSALLATGANKLDPVLTPHLRMFVGVGLVAASAIVYFPLLYGSSLRAMIFDTVLWPRAHFAQERIQPLLLGASSAILAAACVPLAWLAARRRLPSGLLAALKIALAGAVTATVALHQFTAAVAIATPMLWLIAVPPTPAAPRNWLRSLLPTLGALQVLYAYPVAGVQVQFVAVLVIVAAAIAFWDAASWLAAKIPPARLRLATVTTASLVTIAFLFSAHSAYARYSWLEPLALPGAAHVRVEPPVAATLRRLQTASHSCSMLVTLPGLFSLNLFSGRPAPSVIVNSVGSSWMHHLSTAQQEQGIRELGSQPLPCAIYNPAILRLWSGSDAPPNGPLVRFILEDFHTDFETAGYRFMTRSSEPLAGTAGTRN
jgi:hypothetical protein